ncbi:MAG: hypothetical protein WDK96_03930 [Candidatus Paceibacterota bacterium]
MAIFCLTFNVNAQIENIKCGGDSTLVLRRVYAGMLSGTMLKTEEIGTIDKFANIRVGAQAIWQPNKVFGVVLMTLAQTDFVNKPLVMNQCHIIVTPKKWMKIQIGNMATPSSEQRPYSVTADSQFEVNAQTIIPGMAPNAKVVFMPTKNSYFGGGIAYRYSKPEYHVQAGFGIFQWSGYYSNYLNKVGTSLTVSKGRVYNITSYKQDVELANFIGITIFKKSDIQFFADLSWNFEKDDLTRGEIGFLKNFSATLGKLEIKGLIALSYCDEGKSVNPYLFIHL